MTTDSKRRLSCIVCPMSCSGEVEFKDGQIENITGFTCKRGVEYARTEVTAPKRVLTTTVKVQGGELPLLPVVSKGSLPKDMIIACARCLAGVTVEAPIKEGAVVYKNLLNLGVDIVAARDLATE